MKATVLVLLVTLPVGFALTGCGQKGALYRPGHNPNPPEPMVQPAGQNHESDREPDGSRAGDHASGSRDEASRPGPAVNDGG